MNADVFVHFAVYRCVAGTSTSVLLKAASSRSQSAASNCRNTVRMARRRTPVRRVRLHVSRCELASRLRRFSRAGAEGPAAPPAEPRPAASPATRAPLCARPRRALVAVLVELRQDLPFLLHRPAEPAPLRHQPQGTSATSAMLDAIARFVIESCISTTSRLRSTP